MSRIMSAVHIDTGLDPESEPALASPAGDPFRIVLLSDFGGRASRNEPRLRRDLILIDPDNFEEVMERLGTGLELSAGGVPHSMQFRELDDFHPDHLYETLPVFQSLRPPPLSVPRPPACTRMRPSRQPRRSPAACSTRSWGRLPKPRRPPWTTPPLWTTPSGESSRRI